MSRFRDRTLISWVPGASANLTKTVLRADWYCTSNCCNFFAFWSYVNPWKLVRNGHSNLTFHWWLFACVECARQQAVLGMDTPKIADSSRLVVGTAISYFRWFVQKPHHLSVTTWSSTSGPFSKVSYTIKVDCVKFWKATDQKKKSWPVLTIACVPLRLLRVYQICLGPEFSNCSEGI